MKIRFTYEDAAERYPLLILMAKVYREVQLHMDEIRTILQREEDQKRYQPIYDFCYDWLIFRDRTAVGKEPLVEMANMLDHPFNPAYALASAVSLRSKDIEIDTSELWWIETMNKLDNVQTFSRWATYMRTHFVVGSRFYLDIQEAKERDRIQDRMASIAAAVTRFRLHLAEVTENAIPFYQSEEESA